MGLTWVSCAGSNIPHAKDTTHLPLKMMWPSMFRMLCAAVAACACATPTSARLLHPTAGVTSHGMSEADSTDVGEPFEYSALDIDTRSGRQLSWKPRLVYKGTAATGCAALEAICNSLAQPSCKSQKCSLSSCTVVAVVKVSEEPCSPLNELISSTHASAGQQEVSCHCASLQSNDLSVLVCCNASTREETALCGGSAM
jgi:hypothetical protein